MKFDLINLTKNVIVFLLSSMSAVLFVKGVLLFFKELENADYTDDGFVRTAKFLLSKNKFFKWFLFLVACIITIEIITPFILL